MHKKRAYKIIRISLILIVLFVLFEYDLTNVFLDANAAKTGIVNTTGGSLRIRNAPDGETIGSVAKGQAVNILEEQEEWYKIEYGNSYGYVASAYIEMVEVDDGYKKELLEAGFPESYCTALMKLHADYPNWEFVAWDTGLEWEEAVKAESSVGKNTVAGSSISSYKSISKGAYNLKTNTWVSFDSGGWVSASEEIVAYYMDPRNFLDPYYIFQFMDQTYSAENQTEKGLKTVVQGTFLNTKSYRKMLMNAGEQSGVSPYVLASMIAVEQGSKGTGKSISGTQAGYEGYYNFYNIGAYATKNMTAVQRGLWYAKGGSIGASSYNRPWNSKERAIIGGAVYYGKNYVDKGQTTLYLKKFNVQGKEIYSHQYMTNTQAAAAEAFQVAKAYNKITDGKITFRIPVYRNMPESNTEKPKGDGNPVNYLKNIEIEGYQFAPVFRTYEQKYSLIVEKKVKEINISAEAYNNKAVVNGDVGKFALNKGMNKAEIVVTAENGAKRSYIIYVYRGNSADADFENPEEALCSITPTVTVTEAVEEKPEPTTLPGATGDVNGDGKVTVMDLLKVRKAILGMTQLTETEQKLADVNCNGKVDVIDLLRIQKNILGIK